MVDGINKAPKPEPILDLEGTELRDGWKIGKLLKAGPTRSGGFFSVCYLAEADDGALGFLKAFDFRSALREPDAAQALNEMTSAFLFERNLLDYANEKKIRKVVTALFHGQIRKDGAPNDSINYIVFELADGDSRDQINKSNKRDFHWCFLALHNVCVALSGLHRHNIFHQDIKPSNVLVFDDGADNKVADLGRSHCDRFKAPHRYLTAAGFMPYAPPEQIYQYQMPDLILSKKAGDLYELASMMHFFFSGTMLTPVLINKLRREHRPIGEGCWTGKYQGVLPYLQAAFEEVSDEMQKQLEKEIPEKFHGMLIPEAMQIFRTLGNVEPEQRGKNPRGGNSNYDLQWFLSKLDLLSKKARILNKQNAKAA